MFQWVWESNVMILMTLKTFMFAKLLKLIFNAF